MQSYQEVINGDLDKTKYRLRYYNQNQNEAFWEVKKRNNQLTLKNRYSVDFKTFSTLKPYQEFSIPKQLKRVVQIDYKRIVLKDNSQERLTLDSDIMMESNSYQKSFLRDKVLEVKFSDSISINTKNILEKYNLRPTSFSKYGNCMHKILN